MLLKRTLFTKAVFFPGKGIFHSSDHFCSSSFARIFDYALFITTARAVMVNVLPAKYVTVPYHDWDCSGDDRADLRSVEANSS